MYTRDFECAQQDVAGSCDEENDRLIASHEPTGYAFCTKSEYYPDRIRSYRGPDAGHHFLKQLLYEKGRILKLMKEKGHQPMLPLSSEEQTEFEEAQHCLICERHFHPVGERNQEQEAKRQAHINELAPHLEVLSTYQPLAGDLPTLTELKQARALVKELHSDKIHQQSGETVDDLHKRRTSLQGALTGKCSSSSSYTHSNWLYQLTHPLFFVAPVVDLWPSLKAVHEHMLTHKLFLNNEEEELLAADPDWFSLYTVDELEVLRGLGGKVRDHDHYTGLYRGAAHSGCNIALTNSRQIPVFFHNLGNYDGHIIMQNLHRFKQGSIRKTQ